MSPSGPGKDGITGARGREIVGRNVEQVLALLRKAILGGCERVFRAGFVRDGRDATFVASFVAQQEGQHATQPIGGS